MEVEYGDMCREKKIAAVENQVEVKKNPENTNQNGILEQG